ncbi:helix-turn-helix transcriptional regulator [Hyunsoonleella sp. SJ7]|uniref:Helix-turn-helix transcriptional regulator n=1 Tax=Hyunsoonleella aquatilis TaxID=2762758 RepID=A0A923KLF1_9FLAO|nr:helix-turn-helix transcriptional regulator [Hyunsoonleella aquatilis]MBC3757865.1 helix-turn-helix transcriptional regulator [Hyunsoonleella aquatilis]
MRFFYRILCFVLFGSSAFAQHNFKGFIDHDRWENQVYLSVIDDYRTLSNINDEQIITRVSADSTGFFQFTGNQLDTEQKIYKLHVDNCASADDAIMHFEGHCTDSKDILFIAKHNDTIQFPLSFDTQMFCDIVSSNPKTGAFIKIDSLKEEMKFAYSEFRSIANRELNNKKWFKTLQDFGVSLNEPLAELYIYAFLSDRSSPFHRYYLEDLKSNTYYDGLSNRLGTSYPNSAYTHQYKAELASDKFIVSPTEANTDFFWTYILFGLLIISLLFNLILIRKTRAKNGRGLTEVTSQLTKQEQNVLQLLLEDNSNKDIADALFVSVSTVKTHVNNVYRKLNVSSRDELKSLYHK